MSSSRRPGRRSTYMYDPVKTPDKESYRASTQDSGRGTLESSSRSSQQRSSTGYTITPVTHSERSDNIDEEEEEDEEEHNPQLSE